MMDMSLRGKQGNALQGAICIQNSALYPPALTQQERFNICVGNVEGTAHMNGTMWLDLHG